MSGTVARVSPVYSHLSPHPPPAVPLNPVTSEGHGSQRMQDFPKGWRGHSPAQGNEYILPVLWCVIEGWL